MTYSMKKTAIAVLASLVVASGNMAGAAGSAAEENEAKMKYEAALKEAEAAGLIKELKNLHVSSSAMRKLRPEKRYEMKKAHDEKCKKIAVKFFGKDKGGEFLADGTAHGIQRGKFVSKCTILNYGSNS